MNIAEYETALFLQIRALSRNLAHMHRHHHHRTNGLSLAQSNVLFSICKCDMPSISDLSRELVLPDSHISTICRKLEKLGYIERIRDETDQRVVRLRAMEAAKKLFQSEEACRSASDVFKSVSVEDMDDIINGLEKLNSILSRASKEFAGTLNEKT